MGAGVYTIDTGHVRPRGVASYLIVDGGRAAFVDTGAYSSVPNLLEALDSLDIDRDDVEYVLLTHIHLDHAGGAGRLAGSLPGARVLVHPRGAPHMVDPSKLAAAAKAVYGEREFAELYGEIVPIAAERVTAVADGARITLGARTLEFLYTPGHALHHVCIVDRDAGDVFTGDTFGISYRESDTSSGEFIFPTTSPAQFDPGQLHASIARIADLRPGSAYLTHYGRVGRIEKLAADLHSDVDAFVRIAQGAAAAPDRVQRMQSAIYAHLCRRLDAHGFSKDEGARHALLDVDAVLNAAGLDAWLTRVAA
ncbi:MAG TPA: MBL fold metallo-hydrolase [Steroidobacteraceae bacterium]|nr:MBL fold metallo-hydrolase [Steroidobacteraceae bacterium]